MKFDLRKDNGIRAKEFFEGEWYKDGVKQLCADGWPTFIVPVNIKAMELLGENAKLETELAELRERCEAYRKAVEIAKIRLDICYGRFKGCHIEGTGTHDVSIKELPAWLNEMSDILAKYKGDKK